MGARYFRAKSLKLIFTNHGEHKPILPEHCDPSKSFAHVFDLFPNAPLSDICICPASNKGSGIYNTKAALDR